jgi:hypothetical protein
VSASAKESVQSSSPALVTEGQADGQGSVNLAAAWQVRKVV